MLNESTKSLAEANNRGWNRYSKLVLIRNLLAVQLVLLLIFFILNFWFGWVNFSDVTTTEEYFEEIEKSELALEKFDEVKFKNQSWRFASRTGVMPIPESADTTTDFYATSNPVACDSGFCNTNVTVQMHSGINWLESEEYNPRQFCSHIIKESVAIKVNNSLTRYLNYCGNAQNELSGITFSSLNLSPRELGDQEFTDLVLTTLFSAHFTDAGGNLLNLPLEVIEQNYLYKVSEKSLKGIKYD